VFKYYGPVYKITPEPCPTEEKQTKIIRVMKGREKKIAFSYQLPLYLAFFCSEIPFS
jgi:hypothetical protein